MKEQHLKLLSWVLVTGWIAFNLVQHGVWLDEAHAWCVVRDSSSFAHFRWLMRDEGHPWLWHALLWPLAKWGLPVWSMQLLHGAIASATCALLLFRAPFPLAARVLLVGGYFLVFEYAALARNYAPGGLLLLLATDLEHRGRQGWPYALVLVLLAQTHLWATCLVTTWTLLRIVERRTPTRPLAAGMVLGSCLVAFACVLPADQLAYGPQLGRLTDPEHLEAVGRMVTKAFVPIPDGTAGTPWNSSIAVRYPDTIANWAGAVLWAGLVLALPLNAGGRLRYVLGSLAVLAFPLLAPFLSMRYAGTLLFVAIAACWTAPPIGTLRWPAIRSGYVGALLLVQALGGLSITWHAAVRPFSQARASVRCVLRSERPGLPVVVDRYDAGAPVSAYLGRPVYHPERAAYGSFCLWFPRPYDPTDEQVMQALKRHADTGCLVVGKDTLNAERLRQEGLKATVLGAFTGGMIAHDDHVVSWVRAIERIFALPMATRRKATKTWSFTAPLERMTGRFAWHYVEFPHDVQELFSKRGEVRVKCLINGVAADRALMPTKSGYHILVFGGDLRKKAGIRQVGDLVKVELWLDPEPDRINIPEALAETLDFIPEMKAAWDKLTPGMKRNMCYWVGSAKTEPTQAKRVAELLRRFEAGDFQVGKGRRT